ncbi:MAG: DUF4292 domain-containing protein [Bacteroidales bacterium]|nr:DUF4292 domain-containing protein [Bacteroidales bacterium]
MKKITLLFTIVFALFLHSCKSTKQLQTQVDTSGTIPPITEFQTADEIILNSIQRRSNFDWFSANLSGSINLDGDKNNFGGQIRIKNGEQIWINVTMFFMDAARLKITPDSVFIYHRDPDNPMRGEQIAIIRDFSFFKEMTGVEFTFDMLQDILLGNYFLGEPNGGFSYEFSEGNFLITDNRITEDVMFDFSLHNAYYKFISLTMRDRQNRAVRIKYDSHGNFNGNLFPQKLTIRMTEPMLMELNLNYQKIQLNVPQNMPFSIPRSAKRN